MRTIAWSKFALYDVDDADLDGAATRSFPLIPDALYKAVNCGIKEPACQVNFEDFFKGPDIVWVMPHDEVHVVTKGRAEITVHLPPLMKEEQRALARPGSVYFLPRAARVVWRVLDDEPFRHLCICFPDPDYPTPLAASVKRRQG
jgi:hypothetical protein